MGTFIRAGFLLLLGWFSAVDGHAFRYHSDEYGFSISVPEPWEQIPGELMEYIKTVVPLPNAEQPDEAALCFMKGKASRRIDRALLCITLRPYSDFSIKRQFSDSEIRQIAKRIGQKQSQNNPVLILQDGAPADLEELDATLDNYGCLYDRKNHMLLWKTQSDMPHAGVLSSLNQDYFGREGIVGLTYYSLPGQTIQYSDLYQSVSTTFRFDKGKEYRPYFGDLVRYTDAVKVFFIRGAVVGVILLLLLKVYHLIYRFSHR